MEALPQEILIDILKFLSPIDRLRAEQVCRRWRDASRQTWEDIQSLHIYDNPQNVPPSKIWAPTKLVKKEGNQLCIFSDSRIIFWCLVQRVGGFIKKLVVHFDWSKHFITILLMASFRCQNLEVLDLTTYSDKNFDEESFSMLFDYNPKLHSFTCWGIDNLIGELPLRNWRSLQLRSEPNNDEKIVALIECSEALEHFSNRFTIRIVEALLSRRNLKSLHFTSMDNQSLRIIFNAPLLSRLRELVVEYATDETNLLSEMLQHCSQLKILVLKFLEETTMTLLEAIRALPVLETLQLDLCPINDELLIQLTTVKNLSLNTDHHYEITNNGIFEMIKNSTVLEALSLQNTNVTPEMFRQLVGEMNDRHRYLEIVVPPAIFNEVSEICAGSKIRIVWEVQCFRELPLL